MKVAVEDISPVKKKIRIEVPSDAVSAEMNKAIADIAKKAKIPGFRPGKAPKAIVEKHYAEEVRSDVVNRLITDSYFRAVHEQKISPVDMPEIGDVSMNRGEPLSFSATVEVRPDIGLGTYDGVEVKEQNLTVTDEEVAQTIDRLREMYAQLEVVEGRPVQKEDTLVIDFQGFREGKAIDGAKAADYMLALGKGSLIPGFEDQLEGMSKGETREIKVTFPGDYSNAELAGKDAQFTATLKELKRAVVPELNDEFAKDIGDHKSVEDLRARIKEDIEVRKRNEQASAQREELLSKLIEAHSFDVPPGMVERELQSMFRQHATRQARQGVDVKSLDAAAFRDQHRALAEGRGQRGADPGCRRRAGERSRERRGTFGRTAVIARKSGQPVEAVRKYYDSLDGGMDNLRSSLIQEKALGLLLSRAKKVYN